MITIKSLVPEFLRPGFVIMVDGQPTTLHSYSLNEQSLRLDLWGGHTVDYDVKRVQPVRVGTKPEFVASGKRCEVKINGVWQGARIEDFFWLTKKDVSKQKPNSKELHIKMEGLPPIPYNTQRFRPVPLERAAKPGRARKKAAHKLEM